MADDRSITGSAGPGGDVHDDDELADVLAAELQRYATGQVPTLPPVPPLAPEAIQPLAVPRAEPQRPTTRAEPQRPTPGAVAPAAPSAEPPAAETPREQAGPTFRRAERPQGRRSAGPVLEPTPTPHTEDLPVVRRSGFVKPPTASQLPPAEPLDRVLPTGPVTLPEPTASLLEAMIEDSGVPHVAKHAAPIPERVVEPEPQVGEPFGPLQRTGPLAVPSRLYEDWEQSLRSIGRPAAPWEQDEPIIPTGGDPDLPTMALPLPGYRAAAAEAAEAPVAPEPTFLPPASHGAHALPVEEPSPETGPTRRSGRRRAPVPVDDEPVLPTAEVLQRPVAEPLLTAPEPFAEPLPAAEPDVDAEGIDDLEAHHPAVSAATTGAVDLPVVEPRPRTAPVIIERVRTALLNLPTVPTSPTGTGPAAVVGRWLGAFASPLALVLGFGLVGAGSGAGGAVALLAGVLLAVPALVRSAVWSAGATGDGDLQEAAVLGAGAGRIVAALLLVARLGAAAVVLLLVGTTAGAWADRTGALGLGASNGALLGCAVVGLLALVCAALPTRATAVLTLLLAVLGAVGTLLLALVLAPTGATSVPTSAPGAVAAAVAGFVGVGLLLVLCGPDVARWRTDLAHPVKAAVGAVVSAACGALLLAGGTALAARLGGNGAAADEFAGALSDATASALAGPLLVVLLLAAVTLPALLLRSSGAAAARLLGEGRPVRLGAVASGLLALAGALGLLAAGVDADAVAVAAAGVIGIPVAVWAGLLALPPAPGRATPTVIGAAVAVVVGYLVADGLVPGAASPVLAALGLPDASGLRGGPALGLLVALLLGLAAGATGRVGAPAVRPTAAPADTVEG